MHYHKHQWTHQNSFRCHIWSCRKFNLESVRVCKTFRTTTSPFLSYFSNCFSSGTFNLKLKTSKLEQRRQLCGFLLEIEHRLHNCKDNTVRRCHRFSVHFYPTLPSVFLCNKLALRESCLVVVLDSKLLVTKVDKMKNHWFKKIVLDYILGSNWDSKSHNNNPNIVMVFRIVTIRFLANLENWLPKHEC